MDNLTTSRNTFLITQPHMPQGQYSETAPKQTSAASILSSQDSPPPTTVTLAQRSITSTEPPHPEQSENPGKDILAERLTTYAPQNKDTDLPAELVQTVIKLTQSADYLYHGSMALVFLGFDMRPRDIDILCTSKSAENLKTKLQEQSSAIFKNIPGIKPLAIPEQISIKLNHPNASNNHVKIQLNILSVEDMLLKKGRECSASKFDHSATVHVETLEEKIEKSVENNHQYTTKYLQPDYYKEIPSPIVRSLLFNDDTSEEAKQFSVMIRALMAANESLKTIRNIEQYPKQTMIWYSKEKIEELRQSREGLIIALRNHKKLDAFLKAVEYKSSIMPATADFVKQLTESLNMKNSELEHDIAGSPLFQVCELLSLEKDSEPKKHPPELELLYLNCFKLDKKMNSSHSKEQVETKLKTCREQLIQFDLKVREPNNKDIGRLLDPGYILTRPKNSADIHATSKRLIYYATLKNPKMFHERKKLLESLSANYANINTSKEELDYYKSIATASITKSVADELVKNDEWNIETILMFFFPNLKPRLLSVKAPFLKPSQTLYTNSNLSNQPIMRHGPKLLSDKKINFEKLQNWDLSILQVISAIPTLVLCLDKKLSHIVSETAANPPHTFSKQCIRNHILFACDLAHKITHMPLALHTPEIDKRLLWAIYSYLEMTSIMRNQIESFPDECLMLTETLCFLLQNSTIQDLLSKQVIETGEDLQDIHPYTLKKLEETILTILKAPIQNKKHLGITLCLLTTVCNHKMFLTAKDKDHEERISQLAIITTKIAGEILRILMEYDLQNSLKYNQLVHRINSDCTPILQQVCTCIIQARIPEHHETKTLSNTVNALSSECQKKLTEIELKDQAFLQELESSEIKYTRKILKEYNKKKEQLTKAHDDRMMRDRQPQEVSIEKFIERVGIPAPASDYEEQAKATGELLRKLAEQLENCEHENHINDILKTTDNQLSTIEKYPVLQVWAYGDQAYSLWHPHTDRFNRAGRFVEHFMNMKNFCDAALNEASKQPKQYDYKWLYDRNPEQPIGLQSLFFLTRLYSAEKIPALITRASKSVALYEKALKQAQVASHQLTQSLMIDPFNPEHCQQIDHLHLRIGFIIDEMKQIQQLMMEIQPIPDIQSLIDIRKKLFHMLQPPVSKAINKISDSKYTLDDTVVNWKPDPAVLEAQRSILEKLDKAIDGFTELHTRLSGGKRITS